VCVCVCFFLVGEMRLQGNGEDALSFVLFRATLDEGSRSRVQ
jgi:anionic cell wall polymer biosynthesis LytR-Cps2A-Psr (LCP) family protein